MEEGPWREGLEPLSDPLLERALAACYKPQSREEAMDSRLNRVLDFILAKGGWVGRAVGWVLGWGVVTDYWWLIGDD